MAYTQANNPFPITSCGRRRTFTQGGEPGNDRSKESPFDLRKTTKGAGRNFRTPEEGAGMTSKGVATYKRENPGSKLQRARKLGIPEINVNGLKELAQQRQHDYMG